MDMILLSFSMDEGGEEDEGGNDDVMLNSEERKTA
jgi:hypothetical protein